MNDYHRLIEIWKLELQLKEVYGTFKRARAGIQKRSAGIAQCQQEVKHCQERLQDIQRELRDLDAEIQKCQRQIQSVEQGMQSGLVADFEMATHQIDGFQSRIGDLEDRYLELLEEQENLQIQEMKLHNRIQSDQKLLLKIGDAFEQNRPKWRGTIQQLQSEQEPYFEMMNPNLVKQYKKMLKEKERVAVKMHHGSCGACGLRLPQQIYWDSEHHDIVNTCPSCKVFLMSSLEIITETDDFTEEASSES